MNPLPFSQSDLDRIADAVRTAESKTSGEIVPYFVPHSDPYSIARWRGGVACAGIALLVLLAVQLITTRTWIPLSPLVYSGIILVSYLVGHLVLPLSPAFRRALAGHSLMDQRVSQRASAAFLSEEVFKTKERTGILIFLSFFERRVVVLGDTGINAKVAAPEWQGIVHTIVAGVKQGRTADGLVEAIRQCGALLQQHGFERRRDDTDELSDSLRIG